MSGFVDFIFSAIVEVWHGALATLSSTVWCVPGMGAL
jgi:hypothetical protein